MIKSADLLECCQRGRDEGTARDVANECAGCPSLWIDFARRQLVSRLENGRLGEFQESSALDRRIGQGRPRGARLGWSVVEVVECASWKLVCTGRTPTPR